MRTIKDYKDLLFTNGKNTMLGLHLNTLFPTQTKDFTYDASVHNFEEKVEVMAQMYKNGIDVFKDSYKVGSISKAFYQWNLNKYKDFQ